MQQASFKNVETANSMTQTDRGNGLPAALRSWLWLLTLKIGAIDIDILNEFEEEPALTAQGPQEEEEDKEQARRRKVKMRSVSMQTEVSECL